MAQPQPELGKSLDDLWTLADSFGGIRGFKPALAFDPSPIDALIGANIPQGLDLARYLDGMSNISGVGVYRDERRRRIDVLGKTWNSMFQMPALSVVMQRGDIGTIIGVEVTALPEVPHDRPGTPIPLARVPMALLAADAAQTLAPEFYLDTNLPEVQNLAQAVGSALFEGIIDFHGDSGQSRHQ
jgi:hypothetical protein